MTRRSIVWVLGVALALALPLAAARAAKPTPVGNHVDDFSLRDFHGNPHSLADFRDRKIVVLAFLGTECPLVKLYTPRLVEMAREYESRGVQFVGIDANVQDSPTGNRTLRAVVRNSVSDVEGRPATRWLTSLGPSGLRRSLCSMPRATFAMWGGLTINRVFGFHKSRAEHRELAAALDELLDDKEVSRSFTVAGRLLDRPRSQDRGPWRRDIQQPGGADSEQPLRRMPSRRGTRSLSAHQLRRGRGAGPT